MKYMPSLDSQNRSPKHHLMYATKKIASIALSIFVFMATLSPVAYSYNSDFEVESETAENQLSDDEVDYSNDFFDITPTGVYNHQTGEMLGFSEHVVDDESEEGNDSGFTQEFRPEVLSRQRENAIDHWSEKQEGAEASLVQVTRNVSERESRSSRLKKELKELEKAMEPLHDQAETLEQRIDSLNAQMRYNERRTEAIEAQIAKSKAGTISVMEDFEHLKHQRQIHSGVVSDYIEILYEKESDLNDLYTQSSSPVKTLFTSDIQTRLADQEYLAVMEQAGRQVFNDYKVQSHLLEKKRQQLDQEQSDLNQLLTLLQEEEGRLEDVRLQKANLLRETQGQQEEYRRLIEENLKEQFRTTSTLKSLLRNIRIVSEKMDQYEDGLEGVRRSETSQELQEAIHFLSFADDSRGYPGKPNYHSNQEIVWPIDASNGVHITAYFKGKNYPFGTHWALDLRARSVPIYAVASGRVVNVDPPVDAGYSSLAIRHTGINLESNDPNGDPLSGEFTSLYGHMREIYVEEGDYVNAGDRIGLSGGGVGEIGAGAMTTGPHLHLEFLASKKILDEDGNTVDYSVENVDPLAYLPLYPVAPEQIPEAFVVDLMAQVVGEEN